MNLVYILEFKADTSPISKIIRAITGEPYSHTEMMINEYQCALQPLEKLPGENDYHVRKFKNVHELLRKDKRIDAFGVPHKFSNEDVARMLKFWTDRAGMNKEYGYEKLVALPFVKIGIRMMRRYYRRTGKPYPLKCGFWKADVCSTAVDHCLKIGWCDLFPELSERVPYPGLFARKLADYKV
jgi:hypothetical protein